MATPFPGLRGTGDWVTNGAPQDWREQILFLHPNGKMPLTALTARMKTRKTVSPTYHWWTQNLPQQRAVVTSIYINASLATEYVYATHQATNGIAGVTIYAKLPTEVGASEFRVGHVVMLRDADQSNVDLRGIVTARVLNGASSYLAIKLLEADDNGGATYNLATVDTVLVIGNANSEGSNLPPAIMYDPTQVDNYTQIFRTSLDLTRTAMQEGLRLGRQPLKEARRQALELHGIEMEKSFLWSIAYSGLGDNGKPLRTTQGLIPAVKGSSAAVNSDYRTAGYAGATWITSGKTWLDTQLEAIFRYGSTTKLALCGSGCLLAINQLAVAYGTIQLKSTDIGFGTTVQEWLTPFGSLMLKTHPLFSHETTNQNAALVLEPETLEYVYMQDTVFQEDKDWKEGGWTTRDSIDEGYLTECGLQYGNLERYAYLDGFGATGVS